MKEPELWKELQGLEWDLYKKIPVGTFSVDGLIGAEMTGYIINAVIPYGRCLDVGCGALPMPAYMKTAETVNFIGIDPYEGDQKREFPFYCGYAEELPFEDKSFEGVLFATSLDHVIEPEKALSEAYRVIVEEGYLFIWTGLKKNDKKFREWFNSPKPARYNKYHMWAFTEKTLMDLIKDFIMEKKVTVRGNETIFVFKKQ